jgi:hypothetical protein
VRGKRWLWRRGNQHWLLAASHEFESASFRPLPQIAPFLIGGGCLEVGTPQVR